MTIHNSVHRVTLPIADRSDVQLTGFIHVEGTGHTFDHRGRYVSTMSTAEGQLIWHVYVEYPVY